MTKGRLIAKMLEMTYQYSILFDVQLVNSNKRLLKCQHHTILKPTVRAQSLCLFTVWILAMLSIVEPVKAYVVLLLSALFRCVKCFIRISQNTFLHHCPAGIPISSVSTVTFTTPLVCISSWSLHPKVNCMASCSAVEVSLRTEVPL